MLTTGSLYSNFWGGMSTTYYYVRTDEYKQILDRKVIGCFEVPMIHSAVLLKLSKQTPNFSSVNDTIPEDDVILLATNANSKGIPMEVCNDLNYGAITGPLDDKSDISQDINQLMNLRVEIAGKH